MMDLFQLIVPSGSRAMHIIRDFLILVLSVATIAVWCAIWMNQYLINAIETDQIEIALHGPDNSSTMLCLNISYPSKLFYDQSADYQNIQVQIEKKSCTFPSTFADLFYQPPSPPSTLTVIMLAQPQVSLRNETGGQIFVDKLTYHIEDAATSLSFYFSVHQISAPLFRSDQASVELIVGSDFERCITDQLGYEQIEFNKTSWDVELFRSLIDTTQGLCGSVRPNIQLENKSGLFMRQAVALVSQNGTGLTIALLPLILGGAIALQGNRDKIWKGKIASLRELSRTMSTIKFIDEYIIFSLIFRSTRQTEDLRQYYHDSCSQMRPKGLIEFADSLIEILARIDIPALEQIQTRSRWQKIKLQYAPFFSESLHAYILSWMLLYGWPKEFTEQLTSLKQSTAAQPFENIIQYLSQGNGMEQTIATCGLERTKQIFEYLLTDSSINLPMSQKSALLQQLIKLNQKGTIQFSQELLDRFIQPLENSYYQKYAHVWEHLLYSTVNWESPRKLGTYRYMNKR